MYSHGIATGKLHIMCLFSDVMCGACKLMLQFDPPGGPLKGGTKLYVSGVNLGKVATDLQVSIAGTVCNVVADTYVPSQRCVVSVCLLVFAFVIKSILKHYLAVFVKIWRLLKQLTVGTCFGSVVNFL